MPVVPQSTYDEYDGPKIVAYKKIDHFGMLPWDRGVLVNPGIVGNMCFSLATHLGCSPIVIVGGDHAFEGTKTHSTGMREGDSMPYLQDTRFRVKIPGYYGGEVETAEPFLSSMYAIAAEAKHHVVWNCTEGGANIPNCENKPFASVNFGKQGNSWWVIEKALKKFEPGQKELWQANKIRALHGLDKIIDMCNRGLMGECEPKDVIMCDEQCFQILVTHVVQSFHLAWHMKPGDKGFWFLGVRDCTRRIRDELRNAG
jgi:hypothetical protein